MESIEKHIEVDKKILNDPTTSPQMRRHVESELEDLQHYQERHPDDHHDPTPLELFCDMNPSEPECKVFDE